MPVRESVLSTAWLAQSWRGKQKGSQRKLAGMSEPRFVGILKWLTRFDRPVPFWRRERLTRDLD